MCCFAQPVQSVTDTNIFARLTDSGSQLLAYQMRFASKKPNAMILPLPVATPAAEDSVKFISLKIYDDLFKDLDEGFPDLTPTKRSRAGGFGILESVDSAQKLEVHDVGDFIASFVPTVNDFSRLDKQFVIPKESWDKIPVYSDYGFAVFQLKKLKGTTHPMALEFKTRHKDQIFFPTVHIHDGEVHKREKFNHTLYLQAKDWDKKVGRYVNRHVKDRATGFVRSNSAAKNFCDIKKTRGLVLGTQLVHRLEMNGTFENTDIIAKLAANEKPFKLGKSSFGSSLGNTLGSYWPIASIAACLSGFGWLLQRRETLMDPSDQTEQAE